MPPNSWVALLFEPVKCWHALCSETLCAFSKSVSCKVIGPLDSWKGRWTATQRLLIHSSPVSWFFWFCLRDKLKNGERWRKGRLALGWVGWACRLGRTDGGSCPSTRRHRASPWLPRVWGSEVVGTETLNSQNRSPEVEFLQLPASAACLTAPWAVHTNTSVGDKDVPWQRTRNAWYSVAQKAG